MFDSRRVVVTGLGVALPGGCEIDALWTSLLAGAPAFAECRPYGEGGPVVFAGVVNDRVLDAGVPRRAAKKIDRFTLLALAAARAALEDTALAGSDERERVGAIIGNATGGWTFVEPMMYGLYAKEGMDAINAYVATAWFPAAAQGEISILHRLGGYSKTLSADRLSSALALEHAARAVQAGREPVFLAGGAEAPLNALTMNAYRSLGVCAEARSHGAFEGTQGGVVLGEGAAFAVLEDADHARRRGARVRAKLRGVGRAAHLGGAVRDALAAAELSPRDVDYLVCDGAGRAALDALEHQVIGEVFEGHRALRMSAPARLYGDLIGAASAASFVVGCLALEHQTAIPTPRGTNPLVPPPVGELVTAAERTRIDVVLVHGRDDAGRAVAFVLERA